ncbi:glutamate synthase-related protein [Methanobrevibacter sp. DSM 116169]|uniref:glutamate synthase-related protein n=1 Tax=Methanobrevibacter sp. DSM 116169 TaxID=3242727 RepID=UPI0038FD0065
MIYKCEHCGHIYDEDMEGKKLSDNDSCPVCGNPIEDFDEIDKDDFVIVNEDTKIFKCEHCGHIFDETMEHKKLSDYKHCPVCRNPIEDFDNVKYKPSNNSNVYKCKHCGHVYDEEAEGKSLNDLDCCPVCQQSCDDFFAIDENDNVSDNSELAYPKSTARKDESERAMEMIHKISKTGETIDSAMATEMPMPNWDDILIFGNQLDPFPLNLEDEVSTRTVIGKNAQKPMVIESPIYISHMSFGALSREVKVALAKGSANLKTAMASGEGGVLPEEMEAAYKYIFEYVPNKYSVTDENLKNADAIEIKIGQGTKPGLGGHLPAEKVTEEIAKLRGMPVGHDIQSPSKFKEINSKEDLKAMVDMLRDKSEGRPIGVKIAPGKLERDLEFISFAEPDFITIDGRGGATASSPQVIKDSTSIPTIYALSRTRKFLDEHNLDIDLVITGGLRISSDFAKALAMGADAIAIATAALMSVACQQYKQCHIGQCPMGVTTQEEDLRERFDSDKAIKRLENYLTVSLNELKSFAKITGHSDVHDLNVDDLGTFKAEISDYTDIKHV